MILRLLLISGLVFFFNACSVKKKNCYKEFEKINGSKEKISEAKGTVLFGVLPALFKADFSNGISVKLFTPFGQKLGEVSSSKEKICLSLKGENICTQNQQELVKELLHVDVPVSVEQLLTGKVRLGKPKKVYCKDTSLVAVYSNGVKVKYKNGKTDTIFYKQFQVKYFYENGKPKRIEILKDDNKVLKILLSELR